MGNEQSIIQSKRDLMASADHDKLIELAVTSNNILAKMGDIELQIKEMVILQAKNLLDWETKSEAIHVDQGKRISILEMALDKYVPDYTTRVDINTKDIQDLRDNRSYVLGGWKAMLIFVGCVVWLTGVSLALFNILIHLPK